MNKLLGVILASIFYTSFFLHAEAFSKLELPLSPGISGRKRPAAVAIHFSYAHPEGWFHESPECAGKRQSPVNLDTAKFVNLEVPSSLIWIGYENQPQKLKITDNGHTVELSGTWNRKNVPFIRGGPLVGDYLFAQLHFHWGPRNSVGSEHTIGNKTFPMEMHMVHYKRDYETFEGALKHDDGLAVVAFFFEISETSNSGVDILKSGLRKVQNRPKQQIPVKPFSLSALHFMFLKDYASYSGSLTTPPCREVVTWIVSLRPLAVSRKLLESYREISKRWPEKENYRPLQAINGRTIYYVGQ